MFHPGGNISWGRFLDTCSPNEYGYSDSNEARGFDFPVERYTAEPYKRFFPLPVSAVNGGPFFSIFYLATQRSAGCKNRKRNGRNKK